MQKINTALCAFGMSGQIFHAPFIEAHQKFNLYGVLERTKSLANEKYPNVKAFRSLDELLNDKAIELVVLNTPNFTHFEYAKKIIASKKHLIVEKPFTATVMEAQELLELAKQHEVQLSVFQNRRWDSDFKTVQKIINQGFLGDLVEAEIHFDRFEPNLNCKSYKEIPNDTAGSLYDLGPHIIDQALVLFGMPKAVYAHLDSFRKDGKVTDYFDLKFYYEAQIVTLKSSCFVCEQLPAYVFHGTNGSFIKSKSYIQEIDLHKGMLPNDPCFGIEPDSEHGILHFKEGDYFVKKNVTSEKGNYLEFYDLMFEAIRNHKKLPVSNEEALNVIKIMEIALKSNEEKRRVFV